MLFVQSDRSNGSFSTVVRGDIHTIQYNTTGMLALLGVIQKLRNDV